MTTEGYSEVSIHTSSSPVSIDLFETSRKFSISSDISNGSATSGLSILPNQKSLELASRHPASEPRKRGRPKKNVSVPFSCLPNSHLSPGQTSENHLDIQGSFEKLTSEPPILRLNMPGFRSRLTSEIGLVDKTAMIEPKLNDPLSVFENSDMWALKIKFAKTSVSVSEGPIKKKNPLVLLDENEDENLTQINSVDDENSVHSSNLTQGVEHQLIFPELKKIDTSQLPKPNFVEISNEKFIDIAKDHQINLPNIDFKSENYYRYSEPNESDVAARLEYDMDEFDKEWLEHINSARSKNSLKHIKESQFEILIDRIEKEWFDLTKNIPKPVKDDGLHEDIACAVCNDGDCENSNAIVFCDGCNLAVHQGCYGVPFIPEGQWLCRKCMISPDRPVSCQFCPYTSNDTFSSLTDEGYPKNLFNNFNFGAFKLTTESNWTHLLCALFIPELNVENPVFMEPISGTNRIVKGRWTLPCYICKVKTSSQVTSACIQCDVKSCSVSFHATCARLAGLCMRMKEKEGEDEVTMKAWCDKHTPKDFKDRLEVESTLREAQRIIMKKFYKHNDFNGTESTDNSSPLKIGKGRVETLTDSKIHDTIPIIAPKIIVDTLMEKHGNMFENDALLIIKDICKYWSLKRESRRGAPLLKRLHLEPWTTAPSLNKENDMIKQKQYETCLAFRNDLERARLLAELVRKREKEKIKRILLLSKMVEVVCCPILHYLKKAITELKKLDKTEMFQEPVTLAIAPDYFNIVKNPMDFQTMERKLEEFEYENAEDFNKDVRLIISNCTLYNAPDTSYFRNARLFEKQSQPILNFLESLATSANCTKTEDGSNVYTLSNCFDRNWFRIPSIEDFTEENLRPSTREVQFAQNEKLIRKKKSRIHVVNKFKDIVPENSPAILIDDEVVDQTQNHPQNSEPESLIIAPENTPEIKKRRTSNPFVDMAPLKQTQTLEKTTNRPVNQTKQAELDIQNVNFESKITTPTVVKKRGRPPKIRAEIPVIENLVKSDSEPATPSNKKNFLKYEMKVKNFEIASAPEILEVSSSIRGRSKIGGRSRYIKSFENRIAELIPSENITEVSIPEKSKKKGFGVTDLDSNSLIFGVSDLGSNSFMKRLPQFSGKTIDDSGVNSSTDKSPTIGQNLQSSRFGSDLMEHSNDFFVPEKQNLDNSYATLSNGFDQNNSETSSESTENIEINRKRGKSQPPIYETEDSPQKKRKHRGNSVPVLSQSPISSPVEKLDITTKDSENSSKIDNQCELVVNNPRSTRHQKQSAIEVEDIVDSQKTPDGMMTPEPEISSTISKKTGSPKKKKNKQKDLKECASEVAKSDSSEISKNTMNSTKKTNNKNFVQSLETEDQRPIKNTPSKELSDLMKNTAPITQSRKRNRSIEPSLIPKSKNLRDEKDQKKSKDFQKTQTEQLMKEEKLMEFPKTSKISNPKVGRSRVLPELNVSSSEIHEKRKRTTTTLFPGIVRNELSNSRKIDISKFSESATVQDSVNMSHQRNKHNSSSDPSNYVQLPEEQISLVKSKIPAFIKGKEEILNAKGRKKFNKSKVVPTEPPQTDGLKKKLLSWDLNEAETIDLDDVTEVVEIVKEIKPFAMA